MASYPAFINIFNTVTQLIAVVTIAGLVSGYRGVLAKEQLLARIDPLTHRLLSG